MLYEPSRLDVQVRDLEICCGFVTMSVVLEYLEISKLQVELSDAPHHNAVQARIIQLPTLPEHHTYLTTNSTRASMSKELH